MTTRKSKEQSDRPEEAKLCITIDEFKHDLSERISIGKELLKVKIPSHTVVNYGGFMYTPRSSSKVEYDKQAYEEWHASYTKWDDYNKEYLRKKFDIPNNVYLDQYKQNEHLLWGNDTLKEMKQIVANKITTLESFCEKCELFKISDNIRIEMSPFNKPNVVSNKNVFIVHGHDDAKKMHVARVLQTIGLNPIILHEQQNAGMTIIEKLEHYSNNASFAVILLTGDDVFKKNNTVIKRARQNVVFEMGYFMAKLGRNRVFVICDEEADKVGDTDGIVYASAEGSGWVMSLIKELQTAGFDVDANKVLSCI